MKKFLKSKNENKTKEKLINYPLSINKLYIYYFKGFNVQIKNIFYKKEKDKINILIYIKDNNKKIFKNKILKNILILDSQKNFNTLEASLKENILLKAVDEKLSKYCMENYIINYENIDNLINKDNDDLI